MDIINFIEYFLPAMECYIKRRETTCRNTLIIMPQPNGWFKRGSCGHIILHIVTIRYHPFLPSFCHAIKCIASKPQLLIGRFCCYLAIFPGGIYRLPIWRISDSSAAQVLSGRSGRCNPLSLPNVKLFSFLLGNRRHHFNDNVVGHLNALDRECKFFMLPSFPLHFLHKVFFVLFVDIGQEIVLPGQHSYAFIILSLNRSPQIFPE